MDRVWPPFDVIERDLGPVQLNIIPAPWERDMAGGKMNWKTVEWESLAIEDQRIKYAYLRRDLVRSEVMSSIKDVNALFTSLLAIPGLERHDVLKRLADLAPGPLPQITDEAGLLARLADARFVEQCIVLLYECQTPSEQRTGTAIVENDSGFSSSDSRYGTYLARWIKRGNRLSEKHLKPARGICTTHAKQLVRILSAVQ